MFFDVLRGGPPLFGGRNVSGPETPQDRIPVPPFCHSRDVRFASFWIDQCPPRAMLGHHLIPSNVVQTFMFHDFRSTYRRRHLKLYYNHTRGGWAAAPQTPLRAYAARQVISIFQSISIYPINFKKCMHFFNLWINFKNMSGILQFMNQFQNMTGILQFMNQSQKIRMAFFDIWLSFFEAWLRKPDQGCVSPRGGSWGGSQALQVMSMVVVQL